MANKSVVANATSPALSDGKAFSDGQLTGIITAAATILAALVVLTFLVARVRRRFAARSKLAGHGMTSNNPCYVSGSVDQIQQTSGICNAASAIDYDDASSLDGDSFLNSLEHVIFVGYVNRAAPCTADHGLGQLGSRPVPQRPAAAAIEEDQRHSCRRPMEQRQAGGRSSVGVRPRKSRRAVSSIDCQPEASRPRVQSANMSGSIGGSTSNLIASSKTFLASSADSVAEAARVAHTATEDASRDGGNTDYRTESSTDSRNSVNSTSAMMSGYTEGCSVNPILPDLVNSSVPKSSSKHLKRISSAYTNPVSRDDQTSSHCTPSTRSGQILDPLTAGQIPSKTNSVAPSSSRSRHQRHYSHNFGVPSSGIS